LKAQILGTKLLLASIVNNNLKPKIMDKALQTMINNMPEKTGKSLNEWSEILNEKSFSKHTEALKFLKEQHGVSHGFANTIVHLSKEDTKSPDDLLSAQYAGKEDLKTIYDEIVSFVSRLGDDVNIVAKKTSVSITRKKQFALIKPASKARIDLGLKLSGKEIGSRLGDSGPFGTMCTHRVQVFSIGEIDDELKSWLLEAYDKAG
jgi:hypothetical protein